MSLPRCALLPLTLVFAVSLITWNEAQAITRTWDGGGVDNRWDADADADTDGGDFLIWQQQFGLGTAPLTTTQSVPEPQGLLLALIAVATWKRRCPQGIDTEPLT